MIFLYYLLFFFFFNAEVQIAELRAASIAQKKYDLAHERLKFEKEKELAVKEAKSKQWCSNCQKSANYYCCWNTAYCDFECQVRTRRSIFTLKIDNLVDYVIYELREKRRFFSLIFVRYYNLEN